MNRQPPRICWSTDELGRCSRVICLRALILARKIRESSTELVHELGRCRHPNGGSVVHTVPATTPMVPGCVSEIEWSRRHRFYGFCFFGGMVKMGGRWERGSGLLLETQHRIWSLLHANITRHHEGGFALLFPFLCPHHRFMPSHWVDAE